MTRKYVAYSIAADDAEAVASLELRLPILPHAYAHGLPITDSLTDARAALEAARVDAVAAGRAVSLPPGAYRIASNWAPGAGTFSFMPGAYLQPDTGVTIDLTGCTIVDTITKIFHVASNVAATGGIVTALSRVYNTTTGAQVAGPADNVTTFDIPGGMRNDVIRPEWWGATSVPSEVINDDVSALRNRVALNMCAGACNDNEIFLRGMYTVDQSVVITTTTRSGAITGRGATRCGFKAKTTTPTITLLNAAGINGPQWCFSRFQLTGPAFGTLASTGLILGNGCEAEMVWCRALQWGMKVQGSYSVIRRCTFEVCGIAQQWDTADSIEGLMTGCAFIWNGIDVVCANIDMKGTIFSDNTHAETGHGLGLSTGEVYDLNNVSGLLIHDITHDNVNEPANLANTIHLRGGSSAVRVRGVMANVGDTTIFLENCADCEILDVRSKNARTSLSIANNTTQRNVVRGFRSKSATVYGINADVGAVSAPNANIVEDVIVDGAAVGLRLASDSGFEWRDVKFINCVQAGPTIAGALAFVKARNVSWDVAGSWTSDLAGTNNKINAIYDVDAEGAKIVIGAGAPSSGTWAVRDKIYLRTPAAGGFVGKVCTGAGTTGTWKDFGAIAA